MFDLKYVRYKLRVVTGGRGKNGYFAAGEYTHTLRLTSELVDLRVGYANPVLKAQGAFDTRVDGSFPHKTKQRGKNLMVRENGYFAAGEYTHTLRLTSELVDLRVGYANPVSKAHGLLIHGSMGVFAQKNNGFKRSRYFLVRETGIEPVR